MTGLCGPQQVVPEQPAARLVAHVSAGDLDAPVEEGQARGVQSGGHGVEGTGDLRAVAVQCALGHHGHDLLARLQGPVVGEQDEATGGEEAVRREDDRHVHDALLQGGDPLLLGGVRPERPEPHAVPAPQALPAVRTAGALGRAAEDQGWSRPAQVTGGPEPQPQGGRLRDGEPVLVLGGRRSQQPQAVGTERRRQLRLQSGAPGCRGDGGGDGRERAPEVLRDHVDEALAQRGEDQLPRSEPQLAPDRHLGLLQRLRVHLAQQGALGEVERRDDHRVGGSLRGGGGRRARRHQRQDDQQSAHPGPPPPWWGT